MALNYTLYKMDKITEIRIQEETRKSKTFGLEQGQTGNSEGYVNLVLPAHSTQIYALCVCVCGLVRTYIRGQFCVCNPRTGPQTSGDVPGPYNHANQLLINFWTCLIYSMHILKKNEPVRCV